MASVQYRLMVEGDVDQLVDVLARSRECIPHERRLTPSELRTYIFDDPDYHSEDNFVAVVERRIVGMGQARIEKSRMDAGKNDGEIEVEVVPEERSKGIEHHLFDRCLAHLRSKGIGVARSRVDLVNRWQTALVQSYSFEEDYRIYDLMRRGHDPLPDVEIPEYVTLQLRHIKDCSNEELRELNDVMNASFVDHYNSVPFPFERMVNFRDASEDNLMFTLAKVDDELAGVELSEESVKFNLEKGTKTGWIDFLGVVPKHRRAGIGRALLANGMQWLLDLGMDTIYISLVAKNEKAMSLYYSFGFEKSDEAIWYRRPL